MFEIEKNVEIPSPKARLGKYPFGRLEVGDSFWVPPEGLPPQKITTVSAAACGHARRTGRKFTCRTVDGGVRVWRIE